MLRTIIIDDEQHCIDKMEMLLQQFNNMIIYCGAFKTVEDGVTAIENLNPDVVFLDVRLSNETAFDLLNHLSNIDFDIIFTTAYDKYAVQAFRFSALDYLLKPVTKESLAEAIGKANKKQELKNIQGRVDNLLNNLKRVHRFPQKICIPVASGYEYVDTDTIIRCESEINYTIFHFSDRRKMVVSKTLKEFEELLASHNFFRIHNSHLINLAQVKSYTKGKGGFVTLKDGTSIEVSVRRKDDFLKVISNCSNF